MAVDNKSAPSLRNTLTIVAVGLFGLVAGALGGYLGYSFAVVDNSPLIKLKGNSNDSPFDQTYRGMARLEGLELVAGGCDGKPVPLGIIERERQVIDQIEANSKSANLDPPLNVARAIVAYRSAKIADMGSDKQASGYAIQQGMMFLQAAGWKDPSPDRLATIVRESDDCAGWKARGEEIKTLRAKLGFALVVGLVTGMSVGVIYARHTIGMSYGWMSQWSAVGTYSQLADFQYQYADEPHARAALADFLSFAEKLRATGNVTDPKALEVSVARTYVRLAVLDRHAGNRDGYQSDLSRAQDALRAAGSPHSSVEDVERSVNQLESRR